MIHLMKSYLILFNGRTKDRKPVTGSNYYDLANAGNLDFAR